MDEKPRQWNLTPDETLERVLQAVLDERSDEGFSRAQVIRWLVVLGLRSIGRWPVPQSQEEPAKTTLPPRAPPPTARSDSGQYSRKTGSRR